MDFLGFPWSKWAFSKGYAGKNKKISPRLETRPGCKSGVVVALLAWPQKLRRAVYHRPDHRRDFLFTQDIVDGFGNSVRPRSGIRPHVRTHDLDRIRPAQETACERSCFRFVCTRCSLPANLDKAHKGGGVTVVAHQHRCGRSAPILKLRRIPAAHSWYAKAQVDNHRTPKRYFTCTSHSRPITTRRSTQHQPTRVGR